MTDVAEEKANELDALRAIFPDEFIDEGDGQFSIEIAPDEEADGIEICRIALSVKYTETYPNELPETRIDCIDGELSSAEREQLERRLNETAEENVGMPMVFTVASTLKEELTEIMIVRKADADRRREEASAAAAEAEASKFRGTKVTAANFFAWKAAFDAEIGLNMLKIDEAKKGKLTGKQLFEQDKSLAQSDAKFVEEGDVTVDISQFERQSDVRGLDDDEEGEDAEDGVAASLFRSKDN